MAFITTLLIWTMLRIAKTPTAASSTLVYGKFIPQANLADDNNKLTALPSTFLLSETVVVTSRADVKPTTVATGLEDLPTIQPIIRLLPPTISAGAEHVLAYRQ